MKGTLKRQQITVGSIVNSGYYAVVTSGLNPMIFFAFPYGDGREGGAKTKEVNIWMICTMNNRKEKFMFENIRLAFREYGHIR